MNNSGPLSLDVRNYIAILVRQHCVVRDWMPIQMAALKLVIASAKDHINHNCLHATT